MRAHVHQAIGQKSRATHFSSCNEGNDACVIAQGGSARQPDDAGSKRDHPA